MLKYNLVDFNHWEEFIVPPGSEVLSAQAQAGGIAVWMLCPNTSRRVTTYFGGFWTGRDLPADASRAGFIDTVQAGGLVYHVFERDGERRAVH